MRRRAPLTAVVVASLLAVPAALSGPAAPAAAAHRDAASGNPSVSVYTQSGGIVDDGADLVVSVVITNPSPQPVAAGHVSVSVTSHPIVTTAALSSFEQHPAQTPQRSLGSGATTLVPTGESDVVAVVTVPAASVHLPSSTPGVFGLTASVTTAGAAPQVGIGTVVVPGTAPPTVGVAAVMPLTVPASGTGLIPAQQLATDTAAGGVLTRELTIAQRNPELTIGIDPMIIASIRVLGQSAPASARAWLTSLAQLGNQTFPLQYGDADPALQIQAGLDKPLEPSDFAYAMSGFGTPLTVGEPTDSPTPTPTVTPTTGPQLPSVAELTDWPYTLGAIAWPTPGTVRTADLAAFGRAGLPTTILSGSNTNAATLSGTPDAVLPVNGGTALVTDDALSQALQTAASATDAITSATADAALNAQLALAAEGAQSGGIVLASLGRIWPTDASHAATAVDLTLDGPFTRPATLQNALAAPSTDGLAVVDRHNTPDQLSRVGTLLDLAGEHRTGGSIPTENIASFSSTLANPALLTGDVRARLLDLFSVGWDRSADWDTAVAKQLTSMTDALSAVQIVSPESIRQASRQALIPITVTNKLAYPIDVVLRATPSSGRLEVNSDTQKTIAAGSSAKVLVPVRAQLSNGTVFLNLQLYSQTDVRIGVPQSAEVDVHADWEGIGAMIFGFIIVAFFGFGLFRTIQRRRRERATADETAEGETAADAPATAPEGEPRG